MASNALSGDSPTSMVSLSTVMPSERHVGHCSVCYVAITPSL